MELWVPYFWAKLFWNSNWLAEQAVGESNGFHGQMFVKIGPCRYEEMMNPQHGYGMIKPSKKGHPQIGHKFRTQNCLKPQVVDGFRSSIMTLVGQSGPAPKSSVEAQIKRLTRPRVQIKKKWNLEICSLKSRLVTVYVPFIAKKHVRIQVAIQGWGWKYASGCDMWVVPPAIVWARSDAQGSKSWQRMWIPGRKRLLDISRC